MKISTAIRWGRIAILLGILLWLICVLFHPFEPRYQGRRLSAWADILAQPLYDEEPNAQVAQELRANADQAADAIRHVGKRALPYALKWSYAKDSAFKEKFNEWAGTIHLFGAQITELYEIHFHSADELNYRSVQVFKALGPAAAPAIPALIKMLQDKEVAVIAASDLYYIGPDVIPPLIEALTNRNAQVRKFAAAILARFPSQIRPAAPLLLSCLKDEDYEVRETAAYALGSIGTDAPTVVPALMAAFNLETNKPQWPFVSALGCFGTNATLAVPLLVKILESPDQTAQSGLLKRITMNALRKIDPETAKPFIEKWKAGFTNTVPTLRQPPASP
jgi:hypothetical protein